MSNRTDSDAGGQDKTGSHECTVTRAEIEAKGYDIKAVNPHAKVEVDTRTPAELLDLIEQKGKEVDEAIKKLRETLQREV
jgi:type I restriction enzyme M protein